MWRIALQEAAYELFRARDTKGTGRITLAGLVPFFTVSKVWHKLNLWHCYRTANNPGAAHTLTSTFAHCYTWVPGTLDVLGLKESSSKPSLSSHHVAAHPHQDLLRNKVAQRQLHYVITHLHGCDVGKVGTFSFNELLVGLR